MKHLKKFKLNENYYDEDDYFELEDLLLNFFDNDSVIFNSTILNNINPLAKIHFLKDPNLDDHFSIVKWGYLHKCEIARGLGTNYDMTNLLYYSKGKIEKTSLHRKDLLNTNIWLLYDEYFSDHQKKFIDFIKKSESETVLIQNILLVKDKVIDKLNYDLISKEDYEKVIKPLKKSDEYGLFEKRNKMK